MQQFSLFDPDPLPVGAIVRQYRPWIGLCYWPPQVPERKHVMYPYWQIRQVAHPGYEVVERSDRYIAYGDFHLELPDAPLAYQCCAVPYGEYLADSWWFKHDQVIDTGLRWRVPSWDEIKEADPRQYIRYLSRDYGPPYPFESELVDMLDPLPMPWRYGEVTEDNWYQWLEKVKT